MTPPEIVSIGLSAVRESAADKAEALNADPEKRYTPGANKDWIQSLEARQVFPRALTVEMVGSIDEIAHALAGKFRFTCQTERRYSVAEHAVRGSRLLPPALAGAFLLHELSETYLPDVAGPLKPFVVVHVPLPDGGTETIKWSELERRHTHTMLRALRLSSLEPLIYSPEVKEMDWAMLAMEKRDLCAPAPAPWNLPHPPAGDSIDYAWDPPTAKSAFIARFRELFGEGYGKAHTPPLSTDIPF